MSRQPPDALRHLAPAAQRDAVRNYHRIPAAAREVLGESGADAGMEEIAAGPAGGSAPCTGGSPARTP